MKRILYMILRNLIRFPYFFLHLRHLAKSETSTKQEKYDFLRKICYYANRGGNVNVISSGGENLPAEGSYMLFPNHQGMYDVLAIIASHEKPFSIVIKKELENIPLLKWVFRAIGYQAMDRSDIRQSLSVIKKVTEEVKNGTNYVIFAEGTRSKQKNKVGEMKGGSFKCATKAKCPIVPVALVDCYKPFDTNTISSVTVQVHYLKPIYYEEYKELSTTEIAGLVQARIEQKIAGLEASEKTGEKTSEKQ